MEPIIEIVKQNKRLTIIVGAILVLTIIILATTSAIEQNNNQQKGNTITPTMAITPTSIPSPIMSVIPSTIAEKFNVIATSPTSNATNVYPGEIIISFTTDNPITMPDSFNLSIQPQLPQYWKVINSYPTNQIQAQVFGGLQTNTTYTVTVKDRNQNPVYAWSFTTAATPAENSSNLIKNEEQQTVNQSYPLFNYVPYSSTDFDIDYSGKLALIVTVKNNNLDLVKQEVNDWIRSHGVDPSTHTINYQTQ